MCGCGLCPGCRHGAGVGSRWQRRLEEGAHGPGGALLGFLPGPAVSSAPHSAGASGCGPWISYNGYGSASPDVGPNPSLAPSALTPPHHAHGPPFGAEPFPILDEQWRG